MLCVSWNCCRIAQTTFWLRLHYGGEEQYVLKTLTTLLDVWLQQAFPRSPPSPGWPLGGSVMQSSRQWPSGKQSVALRLVHVSLTVVSSRQGQAHRAFKNELISHSLPALSLSTVRERRVRLRLCSRAYTESPFSPLHGNKIRRQHRDILSVA